MCRCGFQEPLGHDGILRIWVMISFWIFWMFWMWFGVMVCGVSVSCA